MHASLLYSLLVLMPTVYAEPVEMNGTQQPQPIPQTKANPEGFSKSTIAAGGVVATAIVFQSGRLVLRSVFTLTKSLIKKPLIAGTLGTMVIAPVLDETLFAQEPDLNARSLARKIRARWKIQRTNAEKNLAEWDAQLRQKYAGTMQDIKTNHPDFYEWLVKIDQQPIMQDVKQVASVVNNGARSALNSLKHVFDEQPQEIEKQQEQPKTPSSDKE